MRHQATMPTERRPRRVLRAFFGLPTCAAMATVLVGLAGGLSPSATTVAATAPRASVHTASSDAPWACFAIDEINLGGCLYNPLPPTLP